MRILIVDDNKLVRDGVARVLSSDSSCQVCGEAADSAEALQKADALRPDLILLDISMPGTNGLETARLLRQQTPEIKILMMSQHDPGQMLSRSVEAGAIGCVDKARIVADLLPSIREIA